jgi:predicted Zn-dependent protease
MNIVQRTLYIILLFFALMTVSCSEVGITGRKQFNFVPDSMMNSMSFSNYSEFISSSKLSKNTQQTEMVKRVGTKIQKAVEKYCADNGTTDTLSGYQWEFNLVEDPNVNAWCMPGGKVVVYTGLLPVTKTEAGLAVVIGHEIAHAFAKHGAERMTQSLAVQLGGIALSTALTKYPEQTKNIFLSAYGAGSNVGVLLPYNRLHENEADHLGLIFMAMAGYNPNEALDFWQRMADASKGKSTWEILSTHPSNETRIQKIKELLPEAMEYYKQPLKN